MKKRALRWFIVLATMLLVLYVWWGLSPNPAFRLENLKGLSPEQVIQKLGPPFLDPRVAQLPGSKGWTPADEPERGPLTLTWEDRWNWRGFQYSVIFADGKVSKVRMGHG